MKRIISSILCLILSFAAFSCGNVEEPNKNENFVMPSGFQKAETLAGDGVKVVGISAEFDPHFFSQNVTRGAKAEDWQIIVDRVKEMKVHRFRVMVLPEWFEPLNDNADPMVTDLSKFTFETAEMKSLYKLLELANEEDIVVNITLWGANRTVALVDPEMQAKVGFNHFLTEGNSGSNWTLGLKGERLENEFCENFSVLINHLINTKKFSCVQEITPINEPDWTYNIDGDTFRNKPEIFNDYASMCRKLHARFKADNLRDKVKFNLSDDAENMNWLKESVTALDKVDPSDPNSEDLADMYNSHTYQFGYETNNSRINKWQRDCTNIIAKTGKPHTIGEFGSNQTNGSTRQLDIDKYERGVLIARQLLGFFNNGSSGMSYWTLFDQFYKKNANFGEMMMLGLWRYRKIEYAAEDYYHTIKEDYELRPSYFSYSMITSSVRRDAQIFPIELDNEFIAGTAFKNPDGKWIYVFANGADGAEKIALKGIEFDGSFEILQYKKDTLPTKGLIAPSGLAEFENQVISFEMPPQTVRVIRQK